MERTHVLSLALAMSALAGMASAAPADPHAEHHPATAAPVTATTPNSPSSTDAGRMDAQMAAMEAMHEKMMAAKSPEEKMALMADHMKLVREGMAMMGGMSRGGAIDGMKCDMAMHHRMMEERMQMMQAMMQMMMDRLPEAPAK